MTPEDEAAYREWRSSFPVEQKTFVIADVFAAGVAYERRRAGALVHGWVFDSTGDVPAGVVRLLLFHIAEAIGAGDRRGTV